MKRAVSAPGAAAALGPYSPAVAAGPWVFVSGQVALGAGGAAAGSVGEQTDRCLEQVARLLEAEGLGLEHVVKTTVFLTDLGQFAQMNEAYARRFQAPYPARATVQVGALPRGAAVEIEAVALRP